MVFTEVHRDAHGAEPICTVLPLARSTYYSHLAKRTGPTRLSDQARRCAAPRHEIRRVLVENWRVYGARKVMRQLVREGFDVARCTVARLLKDIAPELTDSMEGVKTTPYRCAFVALLRQGMDQLLCFATCVVCDFFVPSNVG
ncbi:MAG: IS3 family transposase [Pseudomonadota bacterium]|nr:IS3 family transposase [Pseudomonadota bacterium]